MRLRNLAIRNIRGNWHQYIAYILSSIFTVTVFFIYASFIFHPDVASGYIRGGDSVRQGMVAAEYVIVIFAFLFVLYSNSAFIKSRKKEFGLYSLFGMSRNQLRWMIYVENTLISLLSIVVGIGFGLLFSKLFLMGMSSLLAVESPIRYMVVPKALLYTAVGFFLLFQIMTLVVLLQLRKVEIIQLLKASKQAKPLPVYSRWLVLLAIVTIGAGYYLASIATLQNVFILILPVLFLVVLGTYFLFTQASVAIFRHLQKRKGMYYKGTNLITISNLVYRMKDNARVLFLVATMSAVILTASGTLYILLADTSSMAAQQYPYVVSYVDTTGGTNSSFDPEKVEAIIAEDGYELTQKLDILALPIDGMFQGTHQMVHSAEFFMIANRDYNRLATEHDLPTVSLTQGETRLLNPFKDWDVQIVGAGQPLQGELGSSKVELNISGEQGGAILPFQSSVGFVFIISNEEYDGWLQQIPVDQQVRIYGYDWKGWEQSQATIEKIGAMIAMEDQGNFDDMRVPSYLELRQIFALTFFIGLFVSILFFIANGSLIYFKLFTELEENQQQFRSLYRIGITKQEVKKTLSQQIGLIFLIPSLVGISHASFAYIMLNGLINSNIWMFGLSVILVFLALQLVYYLLTKRMYLRSVFREG